MFQAQWLQLISSLLVWQHPWKVVHLGRELGGTQWGLMKVWGQGKQAEKSFSEAFGLSRSEKHCYTECSAHDNLLTATFVKGAFLCVFFLIKKYVKIN